MASAPLRSNYRERALAACLASQVQYSLLYRAPETNGVLQACKENGVTLVAYSPLCQGLLTGKYTVGGIKPYGPRAGADAEPQAEGAAAASAVSRCFFEAPSPPVALPLLHPCPCCLSHTSCLHSCPRIRPAASSPAFRAIAFAALFTDSRVRQIQPLIELLQKIGEERGKTPAQVCVGKHVRLSRIVCA